VAEDVGNIDLNHAFFGICGTGGEGWKGDGETKDNGCKRSEGFHCLLLWRVTGTEGVTAIDQRGAEDLAT
jgi:hypothetical protein